MDFISSLSQMSSFPVVAAFFALTLILYFAHKQIRVHRPYKVNCWFCNTNTKVAYSLRNSWTCAACHQYNGFSDDGGYNKRIPGQFIESLNRPIRGRPQGKPTFRSNGLCGQCNVNQELKIFQLSSFVANSDKNYDQEVEQEQKRLEKVYELCSPCQRYLSKALKRNPLEKINEDGNELLIEKLKIGSTKLLQNTEDVTTMHPPSRPTPPSSLPLNASFSPAPSPPPSPANATPPHQMNYSSSSQLCYSPPFRSMSHSPREIRKPFFGSPTFPYHHQFQSSSSGSSFSYHEGGVSGLMPTTKISSSPSSLCSYSLRRCCDSPLQPQYPLRPSPPLPLSPASGRCATSLNNWGPSLRTTTFPASFYDKSHLAGNYCSTTSLVDFPLSSSSSAYNYYKSSSVASIFGGDHHRSKTFISPPKFNPGDFNPPMISRSSSQSSGFVSHNNFDHNSEVYSEPHFLSGNDDLLSSFSNTTRRVRQGLTENNFLKKEPKRDLCEISDDDEDNDERLVVADSWSQSNHSVKTVRSLQHNENLVRNRRNFNRSSHSNSHTNRNNISSSSSYGAGNSLVLYMSLLVNVFFSFLLFQNYFYDIEMDRVVEYIQQSLYDFLAPPETTNVLQPYVISWNASMETNVLQQCAN